jgi:hypothetical protein
VVGCRRQAGDGEHETGHFGRSLTANVRFVRPPKPSARPTPAKPPNCGRLSTPSGRWRARNRTFRPFADSERAFCPPGRYAARVLVSERDPRAPSRQCSCRVFGLRLAKSTHASSQQHLRQAPLGGALVL